jgi:flagellin-specific chaperone FliS
LYYLLRYRKASPDCFNPQKKEGIIVFEEAIEHLQRAHNYYKIKKEIKKAKKIKKAIMGFKHCLYYKGGEDLVSIIGDLATDFM